MGKIQWKMGEIQHKFTVIRLSGKMGYVDVPVSEI